MESDPEDEKREFLRSVGFPEIVVSEPVPVYRSPAANLKSAVQAVGPSAKPHPKAQKKSRNERRRAKR